MLMIVWRGIPAAAITWSRAMGRSRRRTTSWLIPTCLAISRSERPDSARDASTGSGDRRRGGDFEVTAGSLTGSGRGANSCTDAHSGSNPFARPALRSTVHRCSAPPVAFRGLGEHTDLALWSTQEPLAQVLVVCTPRGQDRALRPPRRPARPDPPRSASSRRSSWLAGVVCVTRPRVGRVPGGCVRLTPSCGTASARSVVVAPDDLGAHSGSPARTRDRAWTGLPAVPLRSRA